MINVEILKMAEDVKLPLQQYIGDAGADLFAYLPEGTLRLEPRVYYLIPTGFKVSIPKGYEGQVRSRSGLTLKGIVVGNSPGTIDYSYRGQVCIILHNTNPTPEYVEHGQRVAQLVIQKVPEVSFVEVMELDKTDRGERGFGSTGL